MLFGVSCSNENLPDTSGTDEILSIVAEDIIPAEVPPLTILDCRDTEGFIDFYQKNNKTDESILLLKGIVVKENVLDAGIQIKIIEDVRGNFNSQESQLIFWGSGVNESPDNISSYKLNDILFLMAKKRAWINSNGDERPGYYSTVGCAHCITQLIDGYVVGVLYNGYKEDNLTEDNFLKKIKE
jgi:hypothetical protein